MHEIEEFIHAMAYGESGEVATDLESQYHHHRVTK